MSVRRDRANIAIAKDLADRLAETAERLGMTQFALANEMVSLGLDLLGMGYSLGQVRELVRFYKLMTELEIVPVPGRLLDRIIAEEMKISRETAMAVWCDAGKMLASYIRAVFGDIRNVVSFVPYLAKIVPSKRFEVKVEGDKVVVDVIGLGYSVEAVEVNAEAARCLLSEFGYRVEGVVKGPGILHMEAVRA